MPAKASDDADDGVLILREDDLPETPAPAAQDSGPWRILIVDDDVDVHVVTKFALSNANFQGRRLAFLHAYSGTEALDILRTTQDIAIVLLDVIMESPDAGLQLTRRIRDELHNQLVRIVLRTGQPGQALEHSIIVDYDINDFWYKSDLTTRKLFTTVIASLRAYASLTAADAARDALGVRLAGAQQLLAVLDRHAVVLILDAQGRIADANELACRMAGAAREQLLGHDLHALHPSPFPEPQAGAVMHALESEGAWAGDTEWTLPDGSALALRCTVLSFDNAAGARDRYVAIATPLNRP